MPTSDSQTRPEFNITPAALATSAASYRKELLRIPILALSNALNYFSLRTGIRYAETVGELAGNIEMGPHDPYRVDRSAISVTGRTLYTYFGSVVKEFDPNSVCQSVYGSSITKGDELKNVPITLQVLSYLAGKLGKSFLKHLFDAKRNGKGSETKDLFNGIDTITATEIAAGNISVDKGNLFVFPEVIDSTNAVDLITEFCRSASDELILAQDGDDSKADGVNLYIPRWLLYAYRDDYKATTGHTPTYDKFNQTTVEGFNNIRLVPFLGKAKSEFIQLSTKQNMLIGCDQMGGVENISVEKYHAFLLQFVATMFFGMEYESISPECLFVGQLAKPSAGQA